MQKKQAVPASPITPRALTIKEAAAYIGATVWFLRTLAWERRIAFVRLGNRLVFDRVDLDRFIESEKTAAKH